MSEARGGANARALFTDNPLTHDLFGLVAGDYLGCGISRDVYVFTPDPTLVIKFEISTHRFENVLEWNVWKRIQDVKPLARWFAPCASIGPTGVTMLQKRVTLPPLNFTWPERIPAFFTDEKRASWGIFEGRLVCCDYGSNTMLENGMTKRMKKAEWWE